eukprot:58471-Prorocentrum_lima.AAC.1
MVEAVSVSSGTTETVSGRTRSRPPTQRRMDPGSAGGCGMPASLVEEEFLALARKEAMLKGELAKVEQRRQVLMGFFCDPDVGPVPHHDV